MKTIIKLICVTALLYSSSGFAAGGSSPLFHVNVDVDNRQSLQRGAKLFVNYCLSCHAASYSRYKRVATDLGISDKNMRENMIFTNQKLGDPMIVAMTEKDGKTWFGGAPPDLSVRARARGADWIYSFMKSFYLNEKATRGVDNKMLPGTSMPHVMWELQGWQDLNPDYGHDKGSNKGNHGEESKPPFILVESGQLSEEEYDKAMTDLVNFMVYLSEPAQLKRKTIGVGVLFFLAALGILAYFMKRDYWKDVH